MYDHRNIMANNNMCGHEKLIPRLTLPWCKEVNRLHSGRPSKVAIQLHSYICDWASEKGPSGHTKFDHFFQHLLIDN